MALSKITQKRQVVIPENICKAMGAKPGDYVEFIQKDNDIILKPKKMVDARSQWEGQGKLPPAPSYEERMRMLREMEGNAEDDSYDIPLEEIKASRVNSDRIVEFD